MSPGHSTDEQLIAHLDGELHGLAARSVRRHVASCWQCRARMRDLENQALRITKALSADTFPGDGRTGLAMERFDAWRNQHRTETQPGDRRLRWIAAAACLAAAGILSLHRREPAPPQPPDPKALITAVRLAEERLVRQPVHQTLRLEIASSETKSPASTRLEIWSDAAQGRYAFEWRQPDGRLKQAVWRAGGQRTSRFDPASDEGRSSFLELARSAVDLRHFESALYRWLRSRDYTPVSLSSNFAEFAGQDGVTVRLERLDSQTSRLTANQQARELILDVDVATSRPRALLLRVREGAHTMEFRLVADRFETLREDQLQSAVFEPKAPTAIPIPPPPAAVAESTPIAAFPDFEAREIEVHFVLHRVRACLGDPIAVGRDSSGHVVVRGLVESAARKAEIMAAIQGLADVKTEIETVDEASRKSGQANRLSHLEQTISLQVDNASFPLRDRLEAYLPRQQVARFANDAISLSASALAEAWAMHRLTEGFPAGRPDPLGLVKQMLHDHTAAFEAKLRELRALLHPVLPAATPSGTEAPLASAQLIDDLVRSLFSARRSSNETADADLLRLAGALSTEREP